MADQLYLSVWYPNFRLAALPAALEKVMQQFAAVAGSARVKAVTVYPISWTEPEVYQRIYDEEHEPDLPLSEPREAIAAAMETVHDDFAYEFELVWELWAPEVGGGLEPVWRKEPRVVRIVGYGPEFDEGAYEQNGHVRIDFGPDTPFLQEEVDLDEDTARHVKQNVQMLVDFTNAVQQHGGISSRLLWSESGESLAQKLIARLQSVN
ncbi:hypothetical protein HNQ77_003365 [Silvibacterium bohemicum]|uniref:Uncharacterized protein n=1 Tax=Silvibacterium bohemicum TaxID=1577686 RepID=A0A841JYB9_9BACT|nr:hypothetical protein [Silvibacterium bohemicum]MBB6145407.1 hypothetical protein [Silvibacterium bohemicum]